jgi:manganese/zinc/iron transport system permease protein
MFTEFLKHLSDWEGLDTWIAVTGALAAMACALPGTWLLLRRQSLLGDALSHAVLPGIVIAYLGVSWMEETGWLGASSTGNSAARIAEGMSFVARRQLALFAGAALSGVFAAILSEIIQRWGRVERSAALGVVFTSMFALGLLLIRLFADRAHLDPGCVLYGNLEATSSNLLGNTMIPQAVIVNGGMLLMNALLTLLFFKELRLSTFDSDLAAAQGMRPSVISVVLMSVTAATVVAAFESVGAILVIAMLIIPAATARLLSDRLSTILFLGVVVAAVGAVLGHAMAITLPPMICSRLGMPQVKDASTAGMMSIAAFGCFLLAVVASPQHGMARAWYKRWRLKLRIVREDLLGGLFRREEAAGSLPGAANQRATISDPARLSWFQRLARQSLIRQGLVESASHGDSLTASGTAAAQDLVRSHRLWESYMARHFALPDARLHDTAEKVEHFLGPELQAEIAAELDQPTMDPHVKVNPTTPERL